MKVAVVGGGVVGLSTAHYLRLGGATVTVVDRGPIGGGCSAGNAGWICPSIAFPLPAPGLTATSLRWLLRADSPLYVKPAALPRLLPFLFAFRRFCTAEAFRRGTGALAELAADALELHDELASRGIAFEHDSKGLLMLFADGAALDEERRLLELSGYGAKTRTLGPEELRELEPALAPGPVGGLLALPEWHVRPESLCAGLADSLATSGSTLIPTGTVTHIRCESRRAVEVTTTKGSFDVDAVVLAAGAETGGIARRLGARLPLQAGKGYSITVEHPATTVGRPLYFVETKLALTPFDNAVRVAGTMELAGIDSRLNPNRVAALERVAERAAPGVLDGHRSSPWVGMRPLTPDGLPLIGRIATRDNVWVASGHQMLGMTLAPATGRALASWILGGAAPSGLEPFDPSRFD